MHSAVCHPFAQSFSCLNEAICFSECNLLELIIQAADVHLDKNRKAV